jgi:hypothetical protein
LVTRRAVIAIACIAIASLGCADPGYTYFTSGHAIANFSEDGVQFVRTLDRLGPSARFGQFAGSDVQFTDGDWTVEINGYRPGDDSTGVVFFHRAGFPRAVGSNDSQCVVTFTEIGASGVSGSADCTNVIWPGGKDFDAFITFGASP